MEDALWVLGTINTSRFYATINAGYWGEEIRLEWKVEKHAQKSCKAGESNFDHGKRFSTMLLAADAPDPDHSAWRRLRECATPSRCRTHGETLSADRFVAERGGNVRDDARQSHRRRDRRQM